MTSTQYLSSSTMRSTALRCPATERRRLTTSWRISARTASSYPLGEGVVECENRWMPTAQPLAARMRPRDLDEFVGQGHLVGAGRVLRKAIDAGQLPSMILWGPPGTGKTTLAAIGAKRANSRFVAISAVASGVAELRKLIQESRKLRQLTDQRTVLLIDEIHRFNKAQQDVVLPYVENGDVILLGATTENPSFEVNSALLSRSRVYTLQPLSEEDVRTIVRSAMADQRGLAGGVSLADDAENALVAVSNGHAPHRLPRGVLPARRSDGVPGARTQVRLAEAWTR